MTRARDLAAGTFELATGGVLKLETSDTTVTDGSVLGKIEFKAPDEASGTDANLTAAAIEAVAEGTFAADNNATELVFKTGASAAADAKMTLTSGGDLLVGKTSSSLSTAGAELRSGGAITGTVSGGVVAALNRLTNDGNILTFNKDGTTVGSIGALSGDVYIQGPTNHSGIQFNTNGVLPLRNSAIVDNTLDVGGSSYRWKDLYLSGGVYLGGTGAANKLDDYEEGTWTPAYSDAASGGNTGVANGGKRGTYTKVGNLVTITASCSNLDTSGMTAGNDLFIQGVPFLCIALAGTPTTFWLGATRMGHVTYEGYVSAMISDGVQYVRFSETRSNGAVDQIIVSNLLSESADLHFTMTYETSA